MKTPRRERRHPLPELSSVTDLIDDARKLRLSVAPLANHPTLAEAVREAVSALQKTTAALETIADLVSAAPIRARRRRTKEAERTKTPELHFSVEEREK